MSLLSMLALFEMLGSQHPLTHRFRPLLAASLH